MYLIDNLFKQDLYNFNNFLFKDQIAYRSSNQKSHGKEINNLFPEVKGWVPYKDVFLRSLLYECQKETKNETLLSCSSLLNSTLIADGYISSRVYSIDDGDQKFIEIVKGS